jgi:hypothetical protein
MLFDNPKKKIEDCISDFKNAFNCIKAQKTCCQAYRKKQNNTNYFPLLPRMKGGN